MAQTLTRDTFEQTVTAPGIVLVDFWATWCGPCRQFAPIYDAAAQANSDITFTKVDIDDQPELANLAQVTSVPTIMAFRDGICVFAQPGALPAPALNQVIDAVRSLDMDQVRAQVAAAEQGHGETATDGSPTAE